MKSDDVSWVSMRNYADVYGQVRAMDTAQLLTRLLPLIRICNVEEDCKLNGVIWSSIGGDTRSVSPWVASLILACKI